MAYLYYDDSKHSDRGFSLGAFVSMDADPDRAICKMIRDNGFDPATYEFKSSNRMAGNKNLVALRRDLAWLVQRGANVGVAVVDRDDDLGTAGLMLLKKILGHPKMREGIHEVFFDEGLFKSKTSADSIAKEIGSFENCSIHFEQDSQIVRGIQLSDLVAHTAATMLAEELGYIEKSYPVGEGSGYDPETIINLGFELWARLRHSFFMDTSKKLDLDESKLEVATFDVERYGLHIHDEISSQVRLAAIARFGTMYLGCIH